MSASSSALVAGLVLSLLTPGLAAAERHPRSKRARGAGGEAFAAAAPGATRLEGLLPVRLSASSGRVWLELPPADEDGGLGSFLWVESLVTGLGSNPVGLDRGQLGATRLVRLRRVAKVVLFEQPNLRFGSSSANADERQAATEAFASSVLWAAPVVAEEGGAILIELTPFLLQDAHGIGRRLAASGQGDFSLDAGRSVLEASGCHAFPDNLVFEALLTFSGDKPGGELASIAPEPSSPAFRMRHELVRLPAPGFEPRPFHPGAGSFALTFADYSAPLDEEVERRTIVRHRLELDEQGRVKEPIVYHVDRGIPEPVRSAVLDGVSWWAAAFEAAGLPGAFRAELLPEGVHPLDSRHHVVQWVHRATRGWSYGGGIVDPRTGERLKGHVNLGSLRVRQDRLLLEGLTSTARTGDGSAQDPIQVSLARIRQLAAHEVGHSLGLAHSFAASSYGGRASVMDYPAPLVQLTGGGGLDLSQAYAVGVGTWDRHAIRLAYGPLSGGERQLAELVREGRRRGLLFLSDSDARPAGAAHPLASLWDNGEEPVAELHHVLEVRRRALERFGEDSLQPDQPLALLHERFVPIYLFHRYQVEATAKSVAGLEYAHALAGEEGSAATPVPGDRQRAALAALLRTLEPSVLDVPERVLQRLVPRAPGLGGGRELFTGRTAPAFDALAAAEAAAELSFGALLQEQRCARLVDQHRRDPSLPSFDELLRSLEATLFSDARLAVGRRAELSRLGQWLLVRRLDELANSASAAPAASTGARAGLRRLGSRRVPGGDDAAAAHAQALRHAITVALERGLRRPTEPAPSWPVPPGSPIGGLAACSQAP